MTISPTQMYFLTRLDGIKVLLGVTALIMFIMAIIFCVIYFTNITEWDDDECKLFALAKRWLPRSIVITVVMAIMFVATPSTKGLLLIYGVPAIVNSRVVQKDVPQLYDNVIKSINEVLDSKEGSK